MIGWNESPSRAEAECDMREPSSARAPVRRADVGREAA